jgi:hypothetical protein
VKSKLRDVDPIQVVTDAFICVKSRGHFTESFLIALEDPCAIRTVNETFSCINKILFKYKDILLQLKTTDTIKPYLQFSCNFAVFNASE